MRNNATHGKLTLWLAGLFFFSGTVGLLTEQVFERLLSVVVGGSTPAAAVVLSVYFCGLGLGGLAAARWLGKARGAQPFRLYGAAELLVAVCCIGVLFGFDAMRPVFSRWLMDAAGGGAAMVAARLAIASVVVLPAALAMGMSFPALSQLSSRMPGMPGGYLSRLYMVNLFGAAAAALAGPYLLFPNLGLSGALWLCAGIDGAVACFALSARLPQPEERIDAPLQTPEAIARHGYPLLALAFLTGFLFFLLEVVWTQVIAVVVNCSVYAFSSMLFFVTLGLGLGARSINRCLERRREPPSIPSVLESVTALLLFQCLAWPFVPLSMALLGNRVESFALGEGIRWLHVGMFLLPVAYHFGKLYPLLFRDSRLQSEESGRLIGFMGAANSMGCVAGAAAAIFFFIPGLGSERTLRLVVGLLAAAGVGWLVLEGRRPALLRRAPVAAVFALLAILLPRWDLLMYASGMNVYFAPNNVYPHTKLLFAHEDAYGGMTTVVENPGPLKVLLTNGKFQGDDGPQTAAQIGFAAIPSLHLKQHGDALVIGFGTGQSAATLVQLPFRTVDVAEISPGIMAASRLHFGRLNEPVLAGGSSRTLLEDGRNVLFRGDRKYDLITIEISSIWFSGATNLYSHEFYELAASRLNPGGVFQQWVQLHHMGEAELDSVLGTVRSVFPWVTVWVEGRQGIIVAAREPHEIQPEALTAVAAYLEAHYQGDRKPACDHLRRMLDSRQLGPAGVDLIWRGGFRLNTDWNRWLEYATPRNNLSRAPFFERNLARFQDLERRSAPLAANPVSFAHASDDQAGILARHADRDRGIPVARREPRGTPLPPGSPRLSHE